MKKNFMRQYPLLTRLVCYISGFFLLLMILLSALQFWFVYTSEISRIKASLEKLEDSQIDTLVNNLWSLNEQGINIQLQGMLNHPDVSAVVLVADDGTRYQAGVLPDDHTDMLVREFSLTAPFKGVEVFLGDAIIFAPAKSAGQFFFQHGLVRLSAEILALFVTGAFIIGIFFFLVNRHINRIIQYTETIDLESLDQQLVLDRNGGSTKNPDELDRIVLALNDMQKRLNEGVGMRKRIQRTLFREKTFLNAIINALPGIFVVYNQDLKAIRYNNVYVEKLGVSPDNTRDYSFVRRVAEQDRTRFIKAVEDIFRTGRQVVLEVGMISLKGDTIPYLITGSLFELEGEKYLIGLGTELTERKKIEEELQQAQKMEAIGTLAGGIAHDFNNILTAIIGNLQLAQLGHENHEKLQTYLQSAEEASNRAKDLVQQILSISRKGVHVKHPVQLTQMIKEVVKLLRASLPATIEIKVETDSEGFVQASATKIHQVVMNLCTNASQAMAENGGVLSIRLHEVNKEELSPQITLDTSSERYMQLEVSDTGDGMDAQTKSMIFEPYFTTKEAGSGTGLGLAVVHGIVQEHGGQIDVWSEPGKGTRFTLTFPMLTDLVKYPVDRAEMDERNFSGSEHIMLVDDEEDILAVYSELLRFRGYRVSTFTGSDDALAACKGDPAGFDLVITDMTMPHMTGDELGRKILAIRHDMPVIIYTGYSARMDESQCLKEGFAAFLKKPVDMTLLLETIHTIFEPSVIS